MTRPLLWTILLASCTGAPADTDTDAPVDTGPRELPYVSLFGEWWVDGGRLPNQDARWCEQLTPERFDQVDGCWVDATACRQGMRLDSVDNFNVATWIVEVDGDACNGEGSVTVRASNEFGSFYWDGPTEDGTGDVWQVAAQRWIVLQTSPEGELPVSIAVTSGTAAWSMVEDYRWEE